MEKLRIRSNERIKRISLDYQRDELSQFDWSLRLMGIKGARGIGKTTLLLQHLKQTHGLDEQAIYLSLDDIYFSDNKLIDFVEQFHQNGGLFLYLDEVHKYPDWAIEIKNIYDTYPDIKMVFTGSTMLEIHRANADLSRRAIIYRLQGLSFRQFVQLKSGIRLPAVTLEDILLKGNQIISDLPTQFKPYPFFKEYLQFGYYPFFLEGDQWFYDRLNATVKVVLESDFLFIQNIDIQNIRRIYKLLLAIATSPPFKPNIQRLSERTGIYRNTLVQYLYYLEQADVLSLLQIAGKGLRKLQKPDKIYLENTNLLYAFAPTQLHIGMVRETFVLNQLKMKYRVNYPLKGDFLIDEQYTLEVGGKSKTYRQVSKLENSFIIADELNYAIGNKIPIWLFGLMY
jgi:predicted AAA+ superfamily ATPase